MVANSAVQDVGSGIVFSLKFTMYFFCWPSLQCTFFVDQVYNVLFLLAKFTMYSRSISDETAVLGCALPAGLRTPGPKPANPLMWLKPLPATIPPFPSCKKHIVRCDQAKRGLSVILREGHNPLLKGWK